MIHDDLTIAEKKMLDAKWRINNLYYIVDKQGRKIKFNLNWAQESLYDNMWYCNVILKARQLGISTFVCLLFLDRCLFNSNQSAGIIAHTLEDAQQLFRRVKFAYDSLPDQLKSIITAEKPDLFFTDKGIKAQQDSIETLVKVGYIKNEFNFEEHINDKYLDKAFE